MSWLVAEYLIKQQLETKNMNESNLNFCRVCFLQNDEYTSIAGTLTQMELLSVGNIEVFEEDGYPNAICKLCKIILTNAYKFKQICKRSETLLKTFPMTGMIPPKLHIPQEALPNAPKTEVIKLPEPKEMKSVSVGTEEIITKSIGVGCEVEKKSICVGYEVEKKSICVGSDNSLEIKESSSQTDAQPEIESAKIEQMEFIITNSGNLNFFK